MPSPTSAPCDRLAQLCVGFTAKHGAASLVLRSRTRIRKRGGIQQTDGLTYALDLEGS